jgi:hypothetical protein
MIEVLAQEVTSRLAGEIAVRIPQPDYTQRHEDKAAGKVGYQTLIYGDNPAPGASFRYTVRGEETIYPLSVLATLSTGGVAGDRSLVIEYRDTNDARWLVAGAPVTAGPSDTHSYCWHPQAGTPSWVVEDTIVAPLAPQMLYPPQSLVLKLSGAQAGDQISGVVLAVWRYPTGQWTERPDWTTGEPELVASTTQEPPNA